MPGGVETQVAHVAAMPAELHQGFAALQIPDPMDAAIAGRDDPPAVGVEGDAPQGAFLAFDTGSLVFEAEEGSGLSGPQTISLSASDGGQVAVTLAASDDWLEIAPGSGVTPVNGLDVRVNAAGLSPGTYSGRITATGDGYADAVVDVSFSIVG